MKGALSPGSAPFLFALAESENRVLAMRAHLAHFIHATTVTELSSVAQMQIAQGELGTAFVPYSTRVLPRQPARKRRRMAAPQQNRGHMEIKELVKAVEIEGAERGDVVFIEVADSMSAQEFAKFGEAFRTHANSIRADGYFPRCIILPPGTRAVVAQRQPQELVEIGGFKFDADEVKALSPGTVFPRG